MFNGKMQPFKVFKNTIATNEYGEEIKTPIYYKTIDMFISFNVHNPYIVSNLDLTKASYKAVTLDKTLEKGMTIENKYIIEFVNNDGRYSVIFLNEVA